MNFSYRSKVTRITDRLIVMILVSRDALSALQDVLDVRTALMTVVCRPIRWIATLFPDKRSVF